MKLSATALSTISTDDDGNEGNGIHIPIIELQYDKVSRHRLASNCHIKKHHRLLSILFVLANILLCINARLLPDDFQIQDGLDGTELVWTATDKRVVRIGNARYEFRIGETAKTILGHPRQDVQQGKLILPLTFQIKNLLDTTSSQHLSVWSSGKRIDRGAPVPDRTSAVLPAITQTPTVSIDPTKRGPYKTNRTSYELSDLDYNVSPFVFGIEVLAEVTYPTLLPNTKCPFVLILHGRHNTCYRGGPNGEPNIDWPCQVGYEPIPSHSGYRYIADVLASNGYVVISISANGINGQDGFARDAGAAARSVLIRHHLDLWSQWSSTGGDPWNNLFFGKVNMKKTVLVGHSRGGEGVHKAAIDTKISDPYTIIGLVSYGPITAVNQVTPDIHSVTLLPTCDGDVSNLEGQLYIDQSRDIAYSEALRSAVISIGSNHNYFNTEWTPGLAQAPSNDDWYDADDSVCGSNSGLYRLTVPEQQIVGLTYTMALIRLVVDQDETMLQLLDGSYVKPAVVGRAEIATHAVGGAAHRYLFTPDKGRVLTTRGMKHFRCEGFNDTFAPFLPQCDEFFDASPHWTYLSVLPSPKAVRLDWSISPGATATFVVPIGLRNLTGLDTINFRIANDPKSVVGASVKVMIQDQKGTKATLQTSISSIDAWPSSNGLNRRIHARALRANLVSVANIDLSNIVLVALIAESASGMMWVLDIAASQNKIKRPRKLNLPLISVQSSNVTIAGNGLQKVELNITSNKPMKSPGVILCMNAYNGQYFRIRIPAGKTGVVATVPFFVEFESDFIYNLLDQAPYDIGIGALRGVVIGEFYGGLQISDSRTPPTISVTKQIVATEGSVLQWNFKVSMPTTGFYIECRLIPPSTGIELKSDDVPKSWLQSLSPTLPSTPTPLSQLDLWGLDIRFAYGVTTAAMVVPIRNDTLIEGKETVNFLCNCYQLPWKGTLVGNVLAN
jgi:hypothetical protein